MGFRPAAGPAIRAVAQTRKVRNRAHHAGKVALPALLRPDAITGPCPDSQLFPEPRQFRLRKPDSVTFMETPVTQAKGPAAAIAIYPLRGTAGGNFPVIRALHPIIR